MADEGSQGNGEAEHLGDDEAAGTLGIRLGFTALSASVAASVANMEIGQRMLSAFASAAASQIDHSDLLANIRLMIAEVATKNILPKFESNALLENARIGHGALAAAMAEIAPKLEYPVLSANFSFMPVGLAEMVETVACARLLTLERGFFKGSGTAADFFGELDDVINTDQALTGHLRQAVITTQAPGSFSDLDYNAFRAEAADLADVFAGKPDVERQVRSTLEPVQELTGLDDELLIDLGEQLGWWRLITRHKVSTAGLILGYTMGLATFVAGAGAAPVSAPPSAVGAIILGGSIYLNVHGRQNRKQNYDG